MARSPGRCRGAQCQGIRRECCYIKGRTATISGMEYFDGISCSSVLHRRDISAAAKVAHCFLMGQAVGQKSHSILVSPGMLADGMAANRSTGARAISQLEKAGIITKDGPRVGQAQKYFIMSRKDFLSACRFNKQFKADHGRES